MHPAAGGSLRFEVSGTLTIESGARLDVSGLGYAGGDGTPENGEAPAWVVPSTRSAVHALHTLENAEKKGKRQKMCNTRSRYLHRSVHNDAKGEAGVI